MRPILLPDDHQSTGQQNQPGEPLFGDLCHQSTGQQNQLDERYFYKELSAEQMDGEDCPRRYFSKPKRLMALIIALFLLAMTILAASYNLFRAPPIPDRTRPLPPVIPTQGAVR